MIPRSTPRSIRTSTLSTSLISYPCFLPFSFSTFSILGKRSRDPIQSIRNRVKRRRLNLRTGGSRKSMRGRNREVTWCKNHVRIFGDAAAPGKTASLYYCCGSNWRRARGIFEHSASSYLELYPLYLIIKSTLERTPLFTGWTFSYI
jgi:hypothetical protein